MFTENVKRPGVTRRRGRPQGRTEQGAVTHELLYRNALELIAERGYEAATLRDLAKRTDLSPALLYKYFPSKRAILLQLYDELSAEFAQRAEAIPNGRWRDRFLFSLTTSLEVLRPQRKTLAALIPVLLGDSGDGLFASSTSFSRVRVQNVFHNAVVGAVDAPRSDTSDALAHLLYLLHLAVILWWLLDKSPQQRATAALIALFKRALPAFATALRFKTLRSLVLAGDSLVRDALFDTAEDGRQTT